MTRRLAASSSKERASAGLRSSERLIAGFGSVSGFSESDRLAMLEAEVRELWALLAGRKRRRSYGGVRRKSKRAAVLH